ncbi:hypothetical protein C8034_v001938 [Colletotrichum sidae]|uniref:Uncharacterized protein n=1 Tax=Colletotrichum sidae TaxID=1347389 RepID=A0A4R8TD25_9PEZI|nr:hypothetical protein C8034_v001938 [Colletotrichum sidae]
MIIGLDGEIDEEPIPLERSADDFKYGETGDRWYYTHETIPVILAGGGGSDGGNDKDSLCLVRRRTIQGPPCSDDKFCEFVDYQNSPVCTHVDASRVLPLRTTSPFADSREAWPEIKHPTSSLDYRGEVGWCEICNTDFEVIIIRYGRENRWHMELTTYHNLGSCRSPLDYLLNKLMDRSWKSSQIVPAIHERATRRLDVLSARFEESEHGKPHGCFKAGDSQ